MNNDNNNNIKHNATKDKLLLTGKRAPLPPPEEPLKEIRHLNIAVSRVLIKKSIRSILGTENVTCSYLTSCAAQHASFKLKSCDDDELHYA